VSDNKYVPRWRERLPVFMLPWPWRNLYHIQSTLF
jgi:hypothetical protein